MYSHSFTAHSSKSMSQSLMDRQEGRKAGQKKKRVQDVIKVVFKFAEFCIWIY